MINELALVAIGIVIGLGLGYVLWMRPKFMSKDNEPGEGSKIFSDGYRQPFAECEYPYCFCVKKEVCRVKKTDYRR